MKIKIMMMLAAVLMIGMAGGQSYQGATTFDGDITMDEADIVMEDNFVTQINKMAGVGVLVGFTPDCDYIVDGVDDCVEIQAAIDFVSSKYNGGLVRLQNGNYNLSNQIHVKDFVTVCGANIPFRGYQPGAWTSDPLLDGYVSRAHTKFWITNNTSSAFLMGSGSSLRQAQFAYPDQLPGIVPPLEYPAAIKLDTWAGDVVIEYVNAGNSYQFIDANAPHTRLVVTDCVGFPLKYGIVVDNSTDSDYLSRVHFCYPYFPEAYNPDNTTYMWVMNNALAFDVYKADHGKMENCFVYGYYRYIRLTNTADFQIIGGGADRPYIGISTSGAERILIDAVKIASSRISSMPAGGAALNLSGGGHITVSNCIIVSDGHGIKSNIYGGVYTGNVISFFGRNATAAHGGIYIYGGQYHLISNNFIRGGSYANTIGIYGTGGHDVSACMNIIAATTGYGISIAATNGQIIGNHLRTTAGINDAISGTKQFSLNNVIA